MQFKPPFFPVSRIALLTVFAVCTALAQVPVGTAIVNVAAATYRDLGGFQYHIASDTVETIVSGGVSLRITKEVDQYNALPGDSLRYRITIKNTGNVAASNITVIDTLPTGLNYQSAEPEPVIASPAYQWQIDELSAGAAAQINLTGIIDSTVTVGSAISNIAWCRTATGERAAADTITVAIESAPRLAIEKQVDRPLVQPGDTLTYSISVANDGNSQSSNTILRDDLPDNTELVSVSGNGTLDAGIIQWNLGNVLPGNRVEHELAVRLSPHLAPATTIVNHVQVSNGEGQDASASAETLIDPAGLNLLFIKQARYSVYALADTVDYSIIVTNPTNATATGIAIRDTLPVGLSYYSAWPTPAQVGNTLIWEIGELGSGQVDSLQIRAIVNSGEFPILNRAYLQGDNVQAAVATATISISTIPDLELSKTGTATASSGDTVYFSIRYRNTGPAVATEVTVVDFLPPALEYISSSPASTYDAAGHQLEWTLGTLLPGQTDSLLAYTRLKAAPVTDTMLINTAQITCKEGAYKTAEAAVNIIAVPQFELTKTAPASAVSGDTITYQLQYANSGSVTATAVQLVDTLSPLVTYISSSGLSSYDPQAHCVTWQISDLAPANSSKASSVKSAAVMAPDDRLSNSSQSVEQLVVRIISPLANNTMLTNTATISCQEGAGARAAAVTKIISHPVLTFMKTGPGEILPGDSIIYSLTYSNSGSAVATGVIISDTLDAQLELLTASANYSYNSTDHIVSWQLDTIPAGAGGQLTLQARVSDQLSDGGRIYNKACLTALEEIRLSASTVAVNILPFRVGLRASPAHILGNGSAAAALTAEVRSFSGNLVTSAVPVVFASDYGIIPGILDTVNTLDGIAVSSIIADTVVQESVTATVTATAIWSPERFTRDTTAVIFVIGAFDGLIRDYSGQPIEGVAVELIQKSSKTVVSIDTTDSQGYYLIPVTQTADYQIRYSFTDSFGNITTIIQDVLLELPGSGTVITNLNSLSGCLFNTSTGQPVNEAGIPVVITSLVDTTGLAKTTQAVFTDTTYSDSTGTYFFTNLQPGRYRLRIYYNGLNSYGDGYLDVDMTTPGLYVANANVSLRQAPFYTYKLVDQHYAEFNDTLTYTIYYGSRDAAIADSVFLIDKLPEELVFLEHTLQKSPGLNLGSYDPLANVITLERPGIPAGTVDSVIFKAVVAGNITTATVTITNTAMVVTAQDTVRTARDPRSDATTKIALAYLTVKKTVNRRVAEPGDLLTYTVTIQNKSDEFELYDINITDLLPPGFRYRTNRSYWSEEKINDPVIEGSDDRIQISWTIEDTLSPGEKQVLKYRTVAGLNSRFGENDNFVYAQAWTSAGISVQSQTSRATVILKPGILSDRGLIFGKVFYDLNGNALHDNSEPVAAQVELVTETGIRVTTDQFGKYSIPSVRSGDHVVRINRRSLPEGVSVILNSADFLGDPISRLVHVSSGGIAKANFALQYDLPIGLSKVATIKMIKRAITDEFRLLVYKPWGMVIRLGFQPGDAQIKPDLYPQLQKVAAFLNWQEQITLEIKGHTDDQPPPANSRYKSNQELSEARANSIRDYLVNDLAIWGERIVAAGSGDMEPVAGNGTADGRAQNRRVDLIFHSPEENATDHNRLKFQFNIDYSGELPLGDVYFFEALPPGFTYADHSSFFVGQSYEPVEVTEDKIIWSYGRQSERVSPLFEFGIMPDDFSKINQTSLAINYITYVHPDGNLVTTDSLFTYINTLVEELSFKLVLAGAQFDVSSDVLKASSRESIDKLGNFLQWQTDLDIVVEGFTDNSGDPKQNRDLSLRRANSVKNYLVDNFTIAPDRINTRGLGHHYPAGDNNVRSGRSQNRRVEVLVNSTQAEHSVLDPQVTSESFTHQLQYPSDPLDPGQAGQAIILKANDRSTLRLHYDSAGLDSVEAVKINLESTEGIQILNPSDSTSVLRLPPKDGQSVLIYEFEIAATEDAGRKQQLIARLQALRDGKSVGPALRKEFQLLIE